MDVNGFAALFALLVMAIPFVLFCALLIAIIKWLKRH